MFNFIMFSTVDVGSMATGSVTDCYFLSTLGVMHVHSKAGEASGGPVGPLGVPLLLFFVTRSGLYLSSAALKCALSEYLGHLENI